ncbi:terminase [Ochrobactrum pseudogrignonense]|uniref:Terminase n=1 Tax=Brucella pseudogrignonensis TaxID=419475 RepID=A0A7Y3T7A9_9HYPH|nr:terminase gpA endonuclease subunit [Brucella pseudogrignonensis]NNV22081.1 terminase [Brucella pseudogrignonensis]
MTSSTREGSDWQIVLPKKSRIYGRVRKLLTPRPRTDPVQWAKDNREYPDTAGHPGPRNPHKTPYMIPFAMAVHGRTHKRVVMVVSAQSGKSETFLDLIGERLDTHPVPTLYVGPSKDFIINQWEPRIDELMRSTCLKDVVAAKSKQKKTKKLINGVPLRLAHGGSSTAMKSDPFGLALTDEVDELAGNLNGQGDPVGLIDARGDTYPAFVHAITSTPSEGVAEVETDPESGLEFWSEVDPDEIKSTVWRLWLTGTRYHWAWPCPHCGEYFIPRFACLAWDKPMSEAGRELPSTPALAQRTAHLMCPKNGCLIFDNDPAPDNADITTKEWMNDRGVYVAPGQSVDLEGNVIGMPPDAWTLSYWVSGLCSPFKSWGERAAAYVEAVRSGNPRAVQSVKNQGFGELYSPGGGAAPEWSEVMECTDDYVMGEVPGAVKVLTLTCDVQLDRLIYVIRGWGAGGTSWLVEARELYGMTEGEEVWDTFANVLTDTYDGLPIRLALVDSGYRPGKKFLVPEHRVYAFARRFPHLVRATKGSSNPMRKPLLANKIDIQIGGKEIKKGLDLLRLDTDYFKSWVQQKIRWADDAPGAWYLPEDISEDYARQIVSESRMRAPGGKVKWVQRSKENHFLDCESMQGACAMILNLSKLRDDVNPSRRVVREVQPTEPPETPTRPAPNRPARPSSVWNGRGSIW